MQSLAKDCPRCGTRKNRNHFAGWCALCTDCMGDVHPIPGYPEYGIEDDKTVWRLRTGRKRKTDGVCVLLSQRDHRPVNRSLNKLLRAANPKPTTPPPPPMPVTIDGKLALPIPGYPGYLVNRDGEVYNAKTHKALQQSGRTRSLIVSVSGVQKALPIAQAVLEAFVGPAGDGQVICWKSVGKTKCRYDNRLDNVCWMDPPKRSNAGNI